MNKQQGEALITEIERKRDELGMEMAEWIEWSIDIIESLRDAFGVPAETRTHPVKTIIVVERDGDRARRVLYEDWLKTLTIEEIAEDTVQAVKKIE